MMAVTDLAVTEAGVMNGSMVNRVGEALRAARLARGLTQEQVEDATGIRQTYISDIETGKVNIPGDDILFPLAYAVGMSVADVRRAQGWVVEGDDDEVDVTYAGLVPADSVRWTAMQEGDESMRVWRWLLDAHAPETCFVVRVSGDCLRSRGIVDGNFVLLRERGANERPHDGEIVLARIGDEYSLKIWRLANGQVQLVDGDDHVVYRDAVDRAEIVVEGMYVAHWNKRT